RADRGQGFLVARGEAHGAPPVLLAELEADRASEVDKLRFGEVLMQPRPQLVARSIRVVGDRIGPFERGTRGVVEAGGIRHFGIVRQIPVTKLLDALVSQALVDDVLADVAPTL